MKRNATLICDLQFGSTGKGLIAGYIAERDQPDVIMTTWGANAGHTYIDKNGKKFVHTMVANGCVSPSLEYILIGPGSSLNLANLFAEAATIDWPECFKGIFIHPHAGVINAGHESAEGEGAMVSIGSTRKGVGECVIDKIRRNPLGRATAHSYRDNVFMRSHEQKGFDVTVCTQDDYHEIWQQAYGIQIEGAQGFSLGINSGFYPYVTSRECTPAQILSDLCLPMGVVRNTIGCLRTFPIRVANRYDENQIEIGTSGPCYADQKELDWADIGVEPELTTVTKLPRRVFTFSMMQLEAALRTCRPDELFLNFANYCTEDEYTDLLQDVQRLGYRYEADLRYHGFGATANDILDRKQHTMDQAESKEVYRVR
tara:strand:+ start:18318 stop:19430 length:1113 start_codon:yes stop_codon:yes gene_type:complete